MPDTKHTPEAFMEYFRTNYPGPDTIINKPDWHAPKIYQAAIATSAYAELLEACKQAAAFLRSIEPKDKDYPVIVHLDSAILKAEGR